MRDIHRRIIRLESMDPIGIRTQFLISDEPKGGALLSADQRYSIGEKVMSANEWEAAYCHARTVRDGPAF
jgi:hypothetical protein